MNAIELMIVTNAVRYRVQSGEDIESVLAYYDALAEKDKDAIRRTLNREKDDALSIQGRRL